MLNYGKNAKPTTRQLNLKPTTITTKTTITTAVALQSLSLQSLHCSRHAENYTPQ